MDISFSCPHCNLQLEIDDSASGSEIQCPSCKGSLIVPTHAGGGEGHPRGPLSLPSGGATAQIMKPSAKSLETAAKGDKKLKIKTFRHHDCVKEGKDRFDEMISYFLQKLDDGDLVVLHTIQYEYLPKDATQPVRDYGVVVVYRSDVH
jgi:hypothetical protein